MLHAVQCVWGATEIELLSPTYFLCSEFYLTSSYSGKFNNKLIDKMSSLKQTNYFVYPNVIGMIAVTLGLLLTVLCTFKRDIVPYDYLGPISELAYFLAYRQPVVMRAICYTAFFMHVLEGCYAYYLAGMKGISGSARTKWFVFTLLFGIVSMYRLLQYNPTRAQKRD